jgi:hypothetical protein
MMLHDLERRFCKSHSSLEKIGFPTPDRVPTELEEAISLWMSPDVLEKQGQLLNSLNQTHPNNYEQQQAYASIMESIVNFKDANQDDIYQTQLPLHRRSWRDQKIGAIQKIACCMLQ